MYLKRRICTHFLTLVQCPNERLLRLVCLPECANSEIIISRMLVMKASYINKTYDIPFREECLLRLSPFQIPKAK